MEGESKKPTCRRVNTAPTTATLCQTPEGAKQLQAKPHNEPGFDEASVGDFLIIIHFRICHLGCDAETEGNLFGFFFS